MSRFPYGLICWVGIPCVVAASAAEARAPAQRTSQALEESNAPLRPSPRVPELDRSLPPRLQAAVQGILNDPSLDDAQLGFMVWDIRQDRALAMYGEDVLLNPASNAKLLTSAGALALLGPGFRWKTEYFVTGNIQNGVLNGDLVVKGWGDPTVISERLQKVATELFAQGLRKIRGRIIVDDSYFDDDLEARGWELEEAPDRAYAAPVSGLSLNYNAIGVHLRAAFDKDQPAVVSLDPPVKYAYLEGAIATRGKNGRRVRIRSEASRHRTKILVSGRMGTRVRPAKLFRRIYDPPRYFGSALHLFLNQRGIKVRHAVVHGRVPDGARLVYIDESPRLDKVVADLNHYSNNFVAETIVKTVAAERVGVPATFDDGLTAIRAWLETETDFIPQAYTYGNGSGLNDVNRVSASQLCRLLAAMHGRFDLGPEFAASLAVAGQSGTIRHRMRDGPADNRLRAKTGTLTGVSALSGYLLTPRNEVVAFSILVNGWNTHKVRTSAIWDIQNQIAEIFASDGETWVPPTKESADKLELVAASSPKTALPSPQKSFSPKKRGAP